MSDTKNVVKATRMDPDGLRWLHAKEREDAKAAR
jgi:hypothetical protein